MKRLISILLLLAVLLSAAACDKTPPEGGETDPETTSPADETEPKTDPHDDPSYPPQPGRDYILSRGDQTGHPENSAENADVEALLKKSEIDREKEYKIRFVSEGEGVTDENAPVGLIRTSYPTLTNIYATVNVRAFGAVGDGKHDDTQALKDAIDACAKKGGGVVFLPAGFYCLTSSVSVPHHVGLVGELMPGTAHGTVMCLYGNKGETGKEKAAFYVLNYSTLQNLAFWYPEQTIVGGSAIPYPPTVYEEGGAVELRNLTFVNSYFALDLSFASLQYTRDIHVTALHTGYENNQNIDIGKTEKMVISADAWLDSGLPGTPNEALLRAYLLRSTVGMVLERIDWCYIADIRIDGLMTGIRCMNKDMGVTNGSMYNMQVTNCETCLDVVNISWLLITDSVFRSAAGEKSLCIRTGSGNEGQLTMNTCTLESQGDRAVDAKGKAVLSLTDCSVSSAGAEAIGIKAANLRAVNCTVPNTAHSLVKDERMPKLVRADYGKDIVCKPASNNVIRLDEAPFSVKPGDEITNKLQKAIDMLKETGGTVYLPGGVYKLNRHIDVWAGIEIRGAQYWPQTNAAMTSLSTTFGKNDPDGEALFTLYDGAGMVGIGFNYREALPGDLVPYSFTIRGNGKNIYLIDLSMPNSWNAVDFATYRCDNHYVEYIHSSSLGCCFKIGGGSENGIIRDCHNTPNSYLRRSDAEWKTIFDQMNVTGRYFVVGDCKNEILYHNFTYAAGQGLTLTDGADLYSLSLGVDAATLPVVMDGDYKANLVNTELVTMIFGKPMVSDTKKNKGEVNFFNLGGWGVMDVGFQLRTDATLRVIGGIVTTKCGLFNISKGVGEMYGLIYPYSSVMMTATGSAKEVRASGNYCLLDKDFIKVSTSSCLKGGSDTEK